MQVTANARTPSGVSLGIQGLPTEASEMDGGGLYALEATIPSARFALLATTLQRALASGKTCNLIIHTKPEQYLARLAAFGGFDAAALAAQRRLNVLVMQDEFQKKLFRNGMLRLLQEFEHYGLSDGGFVVFDPADEMLSLHDITMALEQAEAVAEWCAQHRMTGLMVFSRLSESSAGAVNALMDSLTGMARLGGAASGLELMFKYWRSQRRLIAARQFPLDVANDGSYRVAAQRVELQAAAELARLAGLPTAAVSSVAVDAPAPLAAVAEAAELFDAPLVEAPPKRAAPRPRVVRATRSKPRDVV